MPTSQTENLKVLIVAEHASAQWGGEAILPLHYFANLRRRGIEAWLVVHERTRDQLEKLLPDQADRIHYVADTALHRLLHRIGRRLPHTINYFSFQFLIRSLTQYLARQIVRDLVARHGIHVVHQPIPVSPREASLMHSVGAPVIIGPMNGGMRYPPAFEYLEPRGVLAFVRAGRFLGNLLNRLMPGKLRAQALLVANERTRNGLPSGTTGRVITLLENGVELPLWQTGESRPPAVDGAPVRFVFAGRLIDWKGVDLLLDAFSRVSKDCNIVLDIIGDGALLPTLKQTADSLGIGSRVNFLGWLAQDQCASRFNSSDVFVLPSLYECGGAVVMEAMACGLPVIATRWGGPADYLDESCGILVEPSNREGFVIGLADAIRRLAQDGVLRRQMGEAGRAKAIREFDWQRKIDRMLEVYRQVASGSDRVTTQGDAASPSRNDCGCEPAAVT